MNESVTVEEVFSKDQVAVLKTFTPPFAYNHQRMLITDAKGLEVCSTAIPERRNGLAFDLMETFGNMMAQQLTAAWYNALNPIVTLTLPEEGTPEYAELVKALDEQLSVSAQVVIKGMGVPGEMLQQVRTTPDRFLSGESAPLSSWRHPQELIEQALQFKPE